MVANIVVVFADKKKGDYAVTSCAKQKQEIMRGDWMQHKAHLRFS